MMRHHSLLLSLALFTAAISSGCDTSSPTVDSDKLQTPADPAVTVSDPAVTASAPAFVASQPASRDSGKTEWDRETAPNAEIADDIPVYKNSIALDGSLDDRLFVFQWETNDAKSDVMDFYREQLPQAGWKVVSEKKYGSFKATKNGKEIDVWIGSPPNEPVSILIRRML